MEIATKYSSSVLPNHFYRHYCSFPWTGFNNHTAMWQLTKKKKFTLHQISEFSTIIFSSSLHAQLVRCSIKFHPQWVTLIVWPQKKDSYISSQSFFLHSPFPSQVWDSYGSPLNQCNKQVKIFFFPGRLVGWVNSQGLQSNIRKGTREKMCLVLRTVQERAEAGGRSATTQ